MRKDLKIKGIEEKVDLIADSIKDDAPMISLPMYSYEADKERGRQRERSLHITIRILASAICVMFLAFVTFLCVFSIDTESYSQNGDGNNIIGTNNSASFSENGGNE